MAKQVEQSPVFKILKLKLEKIAELKGVKLSEDCDRVIRTKILMDLGVKCPCHPDDNTRCCISLKCQEDINSQGHCHCGLYTK